MGTDGVSSIRYCASEQSQAKGSRRWEKFGDDASVDDEVITGKYVKYQGNEYHKLHSNHWLALF